MKKCIFIFTILFFLNSSPGGLAESIQLYRIEIDGFSSKVKAESEKTKLISAGLEPISIINEGNQYRLHVGNERAKDLAYGILKYCRRLGNLECTIKTIEIDKEIAKSEVPFNSKSLIERHKSLIDENSTKTEEKLWSDAQNIIGDATKGTEFFNRIGQAVPIFVEMKTRFPSSRKKPSIDLLLGRYYQFVGWQTKDDVLCVESYLTSREQFQEATNSAQTPEDKELAQYRLAYVNYGLRLNHPQKAVRINFIKETHNEFKTFLTQFPNSSKTDVAQLNVAGTAFELAKLGQKPYAEALIETDKVLEDFPQASEYAASRSMLIKAEILGQMQRQEEAILVCDEILETFSEKVRPSLCTAMRYKADCLFALGRYLEALKTYQEVLATYSQEDVIDQKNIDLDQFCRYFCGRCFQELGRTKDAKSSYQKVLELNPEGYWAPITRQHLEEIGQ